MPHTTRIVTLLLLLAPLCAARSVDQHTQTAQANFPAALAKLTSPKLKVRTEAIGALLDSRDEKLPKIINALLDGQLRFRKSDRVVAILSAQDQDTYAAPVLAGGRIGPVQSKEWKKVVINNRIRTQLRGALAVMQLDDAAPATRGRAIMRILDRLDDSRRTLLEARLGIETDDDVKELLELTLATLSLQSGSGDKLGLIAKVRASLHPSVKQVLSRLAENDPDAKTRQAAAAALQHIQGRAARYRGIETVFFGLSLGSVLVLTAIGLAITFGVMGVINMAHGELIMLGAYTTFVVQQWLPQLIDYSVIIALPLAFMVSGTVGIVIERGVIRFLYNRPLETLLATFGVSLVLQQAVRSQFSPLNQAVETPSWMSGAWQFNEVLALTWNRLYIILFCLLVFAALVFLLKKTRWGMTIRAVSQDRMMTKAMGVRTNWVDAMTFGLGAGVAGMAGVALSQLTNVGPNLGQGYIIDSFMVVVFGGVGNLWGTLISGLGLGVANKLLEPWSGAVLAKILLLVFIILFIQKYPRGLFPQKGRAAEI